MTPPENPGQPDRPDRPQIDYPIRWTYKVIGEDESNVRSAIASVVGNRDHAIAFSHTSSSGKYVSLTVDVLVHNEDERNGVFEQLGVHVDVRVVL